MSTQTLAVKPERLVSLDVFRGITIAGMILVNFPGSWGSVYPPLRHAAWNGWTPTDLIFPFFLFIVGVAMTFSFSNRLARGASESQLLLHVLKRSLIIFALGVFLNGFPYFNLSTLRIPGVLQRIAICYFFASLVALKTGIKGQAITAVVLSLLYWVLMKVVPVPGFGAGVLEPTGNLAWYIDSNLLSGHTWSGAPVPGFDPEGILSTIPAIATTLFGILTGHWLRSARDKMEKTSGLFVMGNVGLFLGIIVNNWFPINKNLWSTSYVIFTAGTALIFLAMCYWFIDVKGYKRGMTPFLIYGTNAIAVYVLSGIVGRLLTLINVAQPDGSSITLKTFLYNNLFASWLDPFNASLAYAVTYILIWLGIMAIFYRAKIFIRI
jgi:predicted acyltransferase